MSENKQSRFFNFTVILTVIPAYVYFTCFIYEQAICNRFGVPDYLIEPNLTTVLIFGTTIWGILFSCLKLLGFSTPLFRAVKDENKRHLRMIYAINGLCLIISIIMFYAYPPSWTLLFVLLGVTAAFNLFTWGLPLLFRLREKKTMKEKLDDIHSETDDNDIITIVMQGMTSQERLFFLVLIMIPGITYFIGDGQALKQKQFQTFASIPNIVVLRKYDDLLVCSDFNRTEKTIGDSLILVKVSESQPVILKSENIGPLKVKSRNKDDSKK